jgi:hypothetical protein
LGIVSIFDADLTQTVASLGHDHSLGHAPIFIAVPIRVSRYHLAIVVGQAVGDHPLMQTPLHFLFFRYDLTWSQAIVDLPDISLQVFCAVQRIHFVVGHHIYQVTHIHIDFFFALSMFFLFPFFIRKEVFQ